jgi:hypothetical protein
MRNDGPSLTTRKIKSEGRSMTGAPFFISRRGVVSSIHAAAKEYMLTSTSSRRVAACADRRDIEK